jgi:hypothetical protein
MARFAPLEVGPYQAVAVLKDRRGKRQSPPVTFECHPSDRKGFIRASRKDPRYLEFSDGTPFFPIGQNLAFIGESQHFNLSRAEKAFGQLSANGANFLRIWTCCEDWALALEARKSAWGRSWAWRPPFVALPAAEGPDRGRKCVHLTERPVEVSPSHPLALRPNTRFVLAGRVRTEGQAAVHLETSPGQTGATLSSEPAGTWTNFRHEFATGPNDRWLGRLVLRRQGTGQAWVNDLSLKEKAGGPELLWEADVNRPIRGFYHPLDCFMLDELVASAEKNGLYLQLCLVTRDLYMSALKIEQSPEYRQAIDDAQKFLRYVVARWGYSTSVAAWEYFNEIDPRLPTDRFYAELGEYLERIDPYRHLRTTSTWSWGPKDSRHPKLDLVEEHFYFRPADRAKLLDEVDAAVQRSHDLRKKTPAKPALLGEFGLANDQWQPTEEMKKSRSLADFHNIQWASALGGCSGTALYWWWDRFDQRQGYSLYRPLSRFLANIPWTSAGLQPTTGEITGGPARLVGMQGRTQAYLWLFNPQASWRSLVIQGQRPPILTGLSLKILNLEPGPYRVQWWDTQAGQILKQKEVSATREPLRLTVPFFDQDIGCKIVRFR